MEEDADELRIGTEERETATAILGEHLAKGRLEIEEYERRAGVVAQARTRGDLRPLFKDLPPPVPIFLLTPAPVTDANHVPEHLRGVLATEGVLLMTERSRGSITYRNYRAPGKRFSWKKRAMSGTVAVTGRRLLVWTGNTKAVDVPFDHALRAAIELTVDKPNRLCIGVVPGEGANWSGSIEMRFKTPLATSIVELWESTR